MAADPSIAPSEIEALKSADVPRPIKFQKVAFLSQAGALQKLSFLVGFPELAERFSFDRLLSRHDFDVDDDATPGQRDINDTHVKRIMEGIRASQMPFIGTLTIALGAEHVVIEPIQELNSISSLVTFTVYEGAPNPVAEDGQHRIAMAMRLWPEVRSATEGPEAEIRKHLQETSVEVTLLLEDEKEVLSTIFVQMGSTKPISPSLIAVMDTSMLQNQLGQYFMRHAKLLENRVSYLSTTASKKLALAKGQKFEGIYGAAAVRSAASSMAGVGFRDRSPDAREKILEEVVAERAKRLGIKRSAALEQLGKELVAALDYAAVTIPGWKQLTTKGGIDAAAFKRDYVHSAAAGLHVIANVICAARIADVDPRAAIDAMATVPWRRDALREGKDDQGHKTMVHELFEGDLVITKFDEETGQWVGGTGGATRSAYEPAAAKVLRHVAAKDPYLKPIADLKVFKELGLVATKGRGRPRKA